MLVKHLAFLGMVGVSAYLTWSLLPALRRTALRQSQSDDDLHALQQREAWLLRLNLVLGGLILLLTAIARAA
jgi:putative copper export protein